MEKNIINIITTLADSLTNQSGNWEMVPYKLLKYLPDRADYIVDMDEDYSARLKTNIYNSYEEEDTATDDSTLSVTWWYRVHKTATVKDSYMSAPSYNLGMAVIEFMLTCDDTSADTAIDTDIRRRNATGEEYFLEPVILDRINLPALIERQFPGEPEKLIRNYFNSQQSLAQSPAWLNALMGIEYPLLPWLDCGFMIYNPQCSHRRHITFKQYFKSKSYIIRANADTEQFNFELSFKGVCNSELSFNHLD